MGIFDVLFGSPAEDPSVMKVRNILQNITEGIRVRFSCQVLPPEIIAAPMGGARDMSRINLPTELEYLRDLRAYKLDVGETYEFCIDKILQCGVRHEQLA
jgi:hypothetical protein